MQRISEYSEAAITIRGTYFPPGKEPKEGERKIYLAIESANELAVQKAKAEITRLIKEELIRLVSGTRGPYCFSYSVSELQFRRARRSKHLPCQQTPGSQLVGK